MKQAGNIHIHPRQILILHSTKIDGGQTTKTETLKDETKKGVHTLEVKQTTVTADPKEVSTATEFVKRVKELHDSMGIKTPMGIFATEDARAEITRKIAEITKETKALNKTLKTCTVETNFLALNIETQITPEITRTITAQMRAELVALRDALKTEEGLTSAASLFSKVRSSGALCAGVQSDAIKFALQQARDVIKAGKPTDESLDSIENAISLFSPSDEAKLPEL